MALNRKFEWKIENLSCWCQAVHGKSIVSPNFFWTDFVKVELYPRGGSGQDDGMEVHFKDVKKSFTCELSFTDYKDSLIYTQKGTITQEEKRVPGPNFEEIVGKIKKAGRKDEITLVFITHSLEYIHQLMCTKLQCLHFSFEIDPKLIPKFQNNLAAAYFNYFFAENFAKGVYILIVPKDDRIQLIMEPNGNIDDEHPLLVESYLNLKSSDEVLDINEEIKHVFVDSKNWLFSESIKVKDLKEKDVVIHLELKVINGERAHYYNYGFYGQQMKKISDISTFQLKPFQSSVPSNKSRDSGKVLSKELMCLYQDQKFSDFKLKCDDVTIPVHRAILSARSPVFDTMLSTDMQEAASGQVDIEDLDPSTLGLLLTFLYTGEVGEDLQCDRALKLYYAADKYQVISLKRECVDFLCSNVSISNVCDILSCGDKHQDDDLLSLSHNFILDNYNDVLESKEWTLFMETDPLLAVKTVTQFARKRCVVKKD